MSANDLSIVLAHGAWADGSSWSKVIGPLHADGYRVIAAPLPLTSLADDVAALDRAVARTLGPVVLVGHAYAGAVLGEVPSERIKAYVYVAALAPAEGETVADVFYRIAPGPHAPKLAPDSHGLIYLPEGAFATAFAPNASPDEQATLYAVQRPISPACISIPVGIPGWKSRPSWFLIAEDDRMIARETQQWMAARMHAQIHSHRVDHVPLITAPLAVLDIIRAACQSPP
jgi:pimeloyl-ACP methyl ester carboxylesterase